MHGAAGVYGVSGAPSAVRCTCIAQSGVSPTLDDGAEAVDWRPAVGEPPAASRPGSEDRSVMYFTAGFGGHAVPSRRARCTRSGDQSV